MVIERTIKREIPELLVLLNLTQKTVGADTLSKPFTNKLTFNQFFDLNIVRIVGISELLKRAQEYIGPNPAWENILAEERRGVLTMHEYVVPYGLEQWQGYYAPWARVSPVDDGHSLFVLAYFRDNKKWQELEVTGHLEECLQGIKENVYGAFFS